MFDKGPALSGRHNLASMRFNSIEYDDQSYTKSHRTKLAAYGAIANVIAKGSFFAASFISVPLTVSYLGAEQYGIWIAISTLIAWLNISDFGFTSSLTNALSEANGKNDTSLAQRFVATAFWSLVIVSAFILLAAYLVLPRISICTIFNITGPAQLIDDTRLSLMIAVLLFCLSFPSGIVLSVYTGFQELHRGNRWVIAGNMLSLIVLLIVIRYEGGIVLLTTGAMGSSTSVKLANLVYQAFVEHPNLKPDPRVFCLKCLRRLWKLGVFYLIQQLGNIGMVNMQPLLLVSYLGPVAAGAFSVTYRLLSLPQQILILLLFPLIGSYGEARVRGDLVWIHKTFRWTIAGSTIFAILAVIPLAMTSPLIVDIWTHHMIATDRATVFWLALLGLANGVATPLATFLQALEKAMCIAFMTVANGLATVILSILLVGSMGPGSLAMAMFATMVAISLPIAVYHSNKTLGSLKRSV